MNLTADIDTELGRAEAARASGNEGRARVCARRAAGMVARDFLNRHETRLLDTVQGRKRSGSSYEVLLMLATLPGLAPRLKQAVVYLTMPVSREFHLPPGIDLIAETHTLIKGLR